MVSVCIALSDSFSLESQDRAKLVSGYRKEEEEESELIISIKSMISSIKYLISSIFLTYILIGSSTELMFCHAKLLFNICIWEVYSNAIVHITTFALH